jgi:hypothetical protein
LAGSGNLHGITGALHAEARADGKGDGLPDVEENGPPMRITRKEVEAVIKLPGEKRYSYFVKKIADQNQVWGLWNEGWAMGITDEGTPTIPLWPAKEYAELCRYGDWVCFQPTPIPLHEFMDEMLPDLTNDGVQVSIFDTPSKDAVFVSNEDLISSLKIELSKIE